jgi:cytoskeletal protein CcmA (bactofilin family)
MKMTKQMTKPYGENSNPAINIISETTKIKGDINATDDIRIDGELNGNISAKGRLVIGPKGKIVGEIDCNNVEISGYIKGKVTANDLLNMKETSKIEGDIVAGKLSVEPGAIFTGSCTMKGINAPNVIIPKAK